MLRRWVLPILILFFLLLSLLTLRSVAPQLVGRQLFFFFAGGLIFFFTSRIPFTSWKVWSPWLYGVLIAALLSTQIFGTVTRGTHSWIPIGTFHIQPSQLAVALAGLALSLYVTHNPLRTMKDLIGFGVLAGIPAILILLEPDLGTTIVYLVSMGSVLFLAPSRTIYLVSLFSGAALVAAIAWLFLLKPYQKDRITSFLSLSGSQSQEQSDASYNAIQSLIAVGSGQLYGRGIGQGIQSHLRFLPERQTDFVFASFAEETGFIGAAAVILLYASLTFFFIYTGVTAQDATRQYFCFLTAAMMLTQSGINIGMNMGLLPITGITLPLFSYGGSSILSLCFHYGVVQSIVLEYQKRPSLHIR